MAFVVSNVLFYPEIAGKLANGTCLGYYVLTIKTLALSVSNALPA